MIFRLIILFLFFCISNIKIFAQCAMCKAVVESDAGIARGVNDGILYLMTIPYILLAIVGFVVYKNYKKNNSDA